VTVQALVVHVHDHQARVDAERCIRKLQQESVARLGYQVAYEPSWDEQCGVIGLHPLRRYDFPDRLYVTGAWSTTWFETFGPGRGPPFRFTAIRLVVWIPFVLLVLVRRIARRRERLPASERSE